VAAAVAAATTTTEAAVPLWAGNRSAQV
jgi:hypothetical protein